MAGSTHPKPALHKPSSASSSHRKSRWESNSNTTTDKKPGDYKSNNQPSSNSSPKTGPSHVKPQPQVEVAAHPGGGPVKVQLHVPPQFPFPDPAAMGPPPPPAYGFHMLDRRTIVLADGSVRSYFSLPPDYQDFISQNRPKEGRFGGLGPNGPGFGLDRQFMHGVMVTPDEFGDNHEDSYGRGRRNEYWNSLGLDGRGGLMEGPMKRKYGEEDDKGRRDEKGEFGRQRSQLFHPGGNPNGYSLGPGDGSQHFPGNTSSPFGQEEEPRASKMMRTGGVYEGGSVQYGNTGGRGGNRIGTMHLQVDQNALNKAFLHFMKLINENAYQKKLYLDNGKQGPLNCILCRRAYFPDMHGLIMHTYNSDNSDVGVDHLGLHKALCVLMGWNYSKPPDNSKEYQFLSSDEARANQDDLIMWPPLVIIHNTVTGKREDGRVEGLGNKAMNNKIRELGFGGGKAKSLYGREGHQGITLVKFSGDQLGLKEAMQFAEYLERDDRGRKGWAQVQPLTLGKVDENHPDLVKVDEISGEKKRILYGYLGTAADLDKIDMDTRKKVVIESRREY